MKLRNRIKELRKNRGLDLNEAAGMLETSTSYLTKIENGKTDISISMLESFLRAYKVSIKDLFLEEPATCRCMN